MPKTKRAPDLTLLGQINSISDRLDEAVRTLQELDAHANRLENLRKELFEAVESRRAQVADLLAKASTGPSQAVSLAKLRTLEKATSAALLKLQMKMQSESRVFTSVSNVLKSRHDTVKNSIGNIR
jgi:hypothetical protein